MIVISALQSGRNVSLISPRRIGKTGLIHNVFCRLKEQNKNATYKTYCEMITKGQLILLRAIAKEQNVKMPFEHAFMQKHGLKAASSVKLALKSLMDKTLILKNEDGAYYVYDRFFSLWLRGGI